MEKCKATTSSGNQCKNTPIDGSQYCHIKTHQDQDEGKLTAKQERFCQLYVSREFFGNGVQSYLEAYGLDPSKDYEHARRSASDNLTKPDICKKINDLLDSSGLNDEFVDKQLLFLITQNADLGQKNAAIREYNKLKSRITERIEDVTPQPKRLVLIEKEVSK